MILSYEQIETIATAVIEDYKVVTGISIEATAIDQLASQYLNLEVTFEKLSDDGSLCGLTVYADTLLNLYAKGIPKTVELKKNQVILDSSFIEPGQVHKLCGKRRFTLAHEVAHQILFALESDDVKANHNKIYSARMIHTPKELKTAEDWNEWQANALGAALLMPQNAVTSFIGRIRPKNKLISYEGRFNIMDRHILDAFCKNFAVSKSAATIRLKNLGFLEENSFSEYKEPLEVMYG